MNLLPRVALHPPGDAASPVEPRVIPVTAEGRAITPVYLPPATTLRSEPGGFRLGYPAGSASIVAAVLTRQSEAEVTDGASANAELPR